MTRQIQLDRMVARFDVETLERAVEIVDSAGVVPVDEDLGLPRRHLSADVAAAVVGIPVIGVIRVVRRGTSIIRTPVAGVVRPIVARVIRVIAAESVESAETVVAAEAYSDMHARPVVAWSVIAAADDRRSGSNDDSWTRDGAPGNRRRPANGDGSLGFGV
jgi:hypothetical protein